MWPGPGKKDLGGTLAEHGGRNNLNEEASCRVANATQQALISPQPAFMASLSRLLWRGAGALAFEFLK
nr:MAG: hypothetical protein DIU57_04690 [Pseudomonadota bacterium]